MKSLWAEFAVAVVAICSGLSGLNTFGAQDAAMQPSGTPAPAVSQQNSVVANESSIAEGKAFFQRECSPCHGAGGKGDGTKADSLEVKPSDLSNPRMWEQTDGALARKIAEGKTPMPSFRAKLSAREIRMVVNYVRTLAPREDGGPSAAARSQANQISPESAQGRDRRKQVEAHGQQSNSVQKAEAWLAPARAASKQNPVPTSERTLAQGKALYDQECEDCHGEAGKGDGIKAETLMVRPADLTRPAMREQTDGALSWKIQEGRLPMPDFSMTFSGHEVWLLVNYIRTLSPKDASRQPSETGGQDGQIRADVKTSRDGENSEPDAKNQERAGLMEYFHVLINPLPIYGLASAVLVLAGALLLRNRPAQLLALGLVFLSAASAWPAYLIGEKAYHRVYSSADADGRQWLDTHKHRAEKLIYLFYALAAIALSAALVPAKIPKTALPLAVLTLVMALVSLGAGAWIGKAGGKIRHPEFRDRKEKSYSDLLGIGRTGSDWKRRKTESGEMEPLMDADWTLMGAQNILPLIGVRWR